MEHHGTTGTGSVGSLNGTGHSAYSQLTDLGVSESNDIRADSGMYEHGVVDRLAGMAPGGIENIKSYYALSPLQEGMLFHHILDKRTDAYVLSVLFDVRSREALNLLLAALQGLVDRHDTLRTAIFWRGLKQPLQVVLKQAVLTVQELACESGHEARAQIEERMRPSGQSFQLDKAPLARLLTARESGQRWYALLQVHHLVCDHRSLRAIVAEVLLHIQHRDDELPRSIAYERFVATTISAARRSDSEAYFRDLLAGTDEVAAPFGMADVYGGAEVDEVIRLLEPAVAQRIRSYTRYSGVSAARLIHAAWAVVVARTTGRDDILYGTVLSVERNVPGEAGRVIGLCVNTLPLRFKLDGLTASQLVAQAHQGLLKLRQHAHSSLTLVRKCAEISNSAPLFTTLLNYRHSEPDPSLDGFVAPGIQVIGRGESWSNYPIAMTIDDLGEEFRVISQTDRRIGAARVAVYLETVLDALLQALQSAPDTLALTLRILTTEERSAILERMSPTPVPLAEYRTVHEAFEEQVRRVPEELAVVGHECSLTFAQLNSKANQLANRLRKLGARPDSVVALCVNRGVNSVVGILGILKAGAAYVPLDPEHPTSRISEVLEECRPCALVCQRRTRERVGSTKAQVVSLDEETSELARQSVTDIPYASSCVSPHHLAYVIYTSGSSGRPKGVMIEHRHVMNLWLGLERVYGQVPGCSRVALNASLSFDASVQQIVQLLSGRTLYMVPQEIRVDPASLLGFLEEHAITGIDCTPSQLKSWITSGLLKRERTPLRLILVGGEAIDSELWSTLSRQSAIRFFNVYGPTECTVDVTLAHISSSTGGPTLGHPMLNRIIYVLDRRREPVPVGVEGEIYIGGNGVARGYLGRPDLTNERFCKNPFSVDADSRMYRTGDLGRWRSDGTLEYLGRNDQQIKIRGFRIELEEIEARLVHLKPVKDAVVLVRGESLGNPHLVAYLTRSGQDQIDIEQVRAAIAGVLPEYMIPSAFVEVESIPLTGSGKVDRRALPEPDPGSYSTREYEAPRGNLETMLASIWQSLLGIDRVGRNDSFFKLGGHSLLIVHLKERLRSEGFSVEVRQVFQNPVLADLARTITHQTDEQSDVQRAAIPPGAQVITAEMLPLAELTADELIAIVNSVPGGFRNIQDIYPLVPLQEGILFHHRFDSEVGDVYVVPRLLSIEGADRVDELIAALQVIVNRHDVLRTAIIWEGLRRPVQVVLRHASLPVKEVTLDEDRSIDEQLNEWLLPENQRLDLRSAPMLQLKVARNPRKTKAYALLQFHHIICDNTSQQIVQAELVALLAGHAALLPEPIPYRKHVEQALARAKVREAESFFRDRLKTISQTVAPFDQTNIHVNGSCTHEHTEVVVTDLAVRVRMAASRIGVSTAAIFHAAWALVVAQTSAQKDVVFGTVLLGRLSGNAGAQRILGMFINTLPLRVDLTDVTTRELVQRVQLELIELLEYEQTPLAIAQRCSGIPGSTPLFTSLLNYRSYIDAQVSWSDAEGIRLIASRNTTNYPITVSIDDMKNGFVVNAQADAQIDPSRICAYLTTSVRSLIDSLESVPETRALNLRVIPETERSLLLDELHGRIFSDLAGLLVHEIFEQRVRSSPEAVAVRHHGATLSYAELNRKANRLGRLLRGRGLGADAVVGICLSRSVDMVIALLGTIKAGAAYLPLDPGYPAERISYMVRDAWPRLILTERALLDVIGSCGKEVIVLDEIHAQLENQAGHDLNRTEESLQDDHLLYVIYTSGSTGRPKGTMMPHRAMVNLLGWHRAAIGETADVCVMQFSALSFDVAFQEIFSTLCWGGTLVLIEEEIRRDVRALADVLEREAIQRVFLPPLMLQVLSEHYGTRPSLSQHLCDVVTAGEQLRISDEIRSFFSRLPAARLHNHYGPTETHVVTALTLSGDTAKWPSLPAVGVPIQNVKALILNEQRQLVPLGATGELYIGGVAVARGYLGKPDLTADRFLVDPYDTESGARLYRTGDLARWSPNQEIEYLGRSDHQVKIRGYRIELGEIEVKLATHPNIRTVAVVAREDTPGRRQLVAYVVPHSPSSVNVSEYRGHLAESLPDYMIPSAFILLEALPTTPSGKVDRRSLPPPGSDDSVTSAFESPRGIVEQRISEIWREVLRVEKVGRLDDFFDLGGNSLSAMQLLSRIEAAFLIEVPIRTLFAAPVLQSLSAAVSELCAVAADGDLDEEGEEDRREHHASDASHLDVVVPQDIRV